MICKTEAEVVIGKGVIFTEKMLKTKKVRFEREWNFFRENGRARKLRILEVLAEKLRKKLV